MSKKYTMIEKNPLPPEFSAWYGTDVVRTPTYAVLPSGKEVFLLNKLNDIVEDARKKKEITCDVKHDEETCTDFMRQLEKNEGKWFDRYRTWFWQPKEVRGMSPIEFIHWTEEKKYTFDKEMTEVYFKEDGTARFHGNLNEFSCAFSFDIIDSDIINDVIRKTKMKPRKI